MQTDIANYHAELSAHDRHICIYLAEQINKHLPNASAKVWHGHPVWFIEDNPIVGYSKQKQGIQLLFWSGQSFDEPSLKPEGKFKAAAYYLQDTADLPSAELSALLKKAQEIQWDYKNLVKRKGILERLQ
ncbi:MAG TPA: hypothetical protein DCO78_06665 [Chitinophagaceae bacterium]|nr:hypothetical protein [Chitinophagaceae bacterium]